MAGKKTTAPISFEESLEKLEEVVRQLEDGKLGLSESLARYEEGIKYLKTCHTALEEAERKIELLTAVNEEGRPTLEPFDEDDGGDEKIRSRRRSRSTNKKTEPPSADADVDTQRGLF